MLRIKTAIEPYGAIVTLRMMVSLPREIVSRSRHRDLPKPINVPAMIDSGADYTIVDCSVVVALRLQITGQYLLRSLDSADKEEMLNAYDMDVQFVSDGAASTRFTIRTAAKTLGDLPYKALIGRDLLQHCRLDYNGPENEIVLIV